MRQRLLANLTRNEKQQHHIQLNPISASSIDPNEKPYVDTTTPEEEEDNLIMNNEEFKEEMHLFGEQSKTSLLMSSTNAPRFNMYDEEEDQEEEITLSG